MDGGVRRARKGCSGSLPEPSGWQPERSGWRLERSISRLDASGSRPEPSGRWAEGSGMDSEWFERAPERSGHGLDGSGDHGNVPRGIWSARAVNEGVRGGEWRELAGRRLPLRSARPAEAGASPAPVRSQTRTREGER